MLSGIIRARATFSWFPATVKDMDGNQDRSSAENDLEGCSSTTAALHEYFGLTGTTIELISSARGPCYAILVNEKSSFSTTLWMLQARACSPWLCGSVCCAK